MGVKVHFRIFTPHLKQHEGCDLMLEYDEYKVQLNNLAESINELRDSL